ncbi:MAG: hypothetical protein SNG27_09570 [Rikenellaceae bacterium]
MNSAIISDDNFIRIISVEGTKVILELAENEGQQSRVAELQFMSSEGEVVESVFVEQTSSYSELSFYFGVDSRSTLPDSDIEINRVTMIAFDSQGTLLFNNTDNSPELNGSEYKLYFKFEEEYYDSCTLFTIVNGGDSYSDVTDMSEVELLKSSITEGEVLSAKNDGVYLSKEQTSTIGVALEYAGIAKIAFTINYSDGIAESDRVISSIKITGQIYTNTYLFKDSTVGLDVSSSIEVDTDSLNCLVGGGSSISGMEITLQNGDKYIITLQLTPQSGYLYSYTITITPYSLTASNSTIEGWDDMNDGIIQ